MLAQICAGMALGVVVGVVLVAVFYVEARLVLGRKEVR